MKEEDRAFLKIVARYLARKVGDIDKIVVSDYGKRLEIVYKNGERDLVLL